MMGINLYMKNSKVMINIELVGIFKTPYCKKKLWGNVKYKVYLNLSMENKIHDFWKLNLDFIEGCKDCEFHYYVL